MNPVADPPSQNSDRPDLPAPAIQDQLRSRSIAIALQEMTESELIALLKRLMPEYINPNPANAVVPVSIV
jgi:hypothetical protein